MRKLIIPLVVASIALTGCISGPRSSGQGTVTSLEADPAVYYTRQECERKYSKARCTLPVLKEPAEWELSFADAGSGREQEVEVPQFVYDNCEVGDFFNGDSCSAGLTPSPAVS